MQDFLFPNIFFIFYSRILDFFSIISLHLLFLAFIFDMLYFFHSMNVLVYMNCFTKVFLQYTN